VFNARSQVAFHQACSLGARVNPTRRGAGPWAHHRPADAVSRDRRPQMPDPCADGWTRILCRSRITALAPCIA
jgi:hypothetical protein